ncbi:hypothetical protein KQX54_007147 [Cotesia glomerata]|uniref:Dynein heavy chain tail domain-containing protein n=1 Tax=Cotesia glomerata TaxID=32391 RepID=A0AAV7I4H2_COTGL|nr:hypothetical protein KQX54_007147 [Cotesia glomerata]
MSGRRGEVSDSKKIKRVDKTPPVINYREYLDMDTDEEEFGRQETPEPDEELPAEPEKPVFTDQELGTLVQYVKNLTMTFHEEITLPQESTKLIHEYFCNPSYTILTIFYQDSQWKVTLDFPKYPQNGLTYFFRSPWQVYTPDNFMSTVKFGSFNYFENSLLKFFQNIYAPVAFSYDRWPRVKKDEIFSNLNKLISYLNDLTYDPMGLPILYVPREGIDCKISSSSSINSSSQQIDIQEDYKSVELLLISEEKNGLIERLERVARYWIKQIREVLSGSNIPARPACRTIKEEINFWNYKFESLKCLHNQLTNKCITNIIDTLKTNKSASIEEFPVLITKIEKSLVEIISNIKYLNLFVDYCCDFEIPGGIEDYTTKILYLIRFVATESQFYNTTDKIEILCRALGTQIINQSKKYIDLKIILDEDPLAGKQMLENSIFCCRRFEEIFNQRCQDLIEVTNTRIIFDKCGEIKIIGGAKAEEHEKKYKKIEKLFSQTLEEIKISRECILNVEEFGWLEKIKVFRNKIEDIDNMMKNLIHDVFEEVLTVEEGLEALYAMKRFVIRENLKETLDSYWTFIWKIFNQELETVVDDIDKEILVYDRSMTSYAGAATLLALKNNYLTSQFNMLVNASDWFDDNIAQEAIIEKYKRVQSTLLEKISEINLTWEQKLLSDDAIKEMLNKPIIKYANYPNNKFMEVNLNFYCLETIKSLIEWKNMKYEIKKISPKLLQKWNLFMIRYIKVNYLCKFYNNIIEKMSKEEFMLFKLVIDEIKVIVTTGVAKNTWIVESIDKFYDECYNNVYQASYFCQ